MNYKSTDNRFGIIPVAIHWVTAVLIIGLMISGYSAARMTDPVSKADILGLHAPIGTFIAILTLTRIAWWIFWDKKPAPVSGMPIMQERGARVVHLLLYTAIILSTASGIAMFLLSGAGPIIAGWVDDPLPDFTKLPPKLGHIIGAWSIGILFIFHAGAALYHQFIQKDGLLKRMWFSRG